MQQVFFFLHFVIPNIQVILFETTEWLGLAKYLKYVFYSQNLRLH